MNERRSSIKSRPDSRSSKSSTRPTSSDNASDNYEDDTEEDEVGEEFSSVQGVILWLKDYAWDNYEWTKREFVRFLTSFMGIHYVFIVSFSIVLSIILYGVKNISYTDALFEGVSAATSTGLNTVSTNELRLYQQIVLFLAPVFSHQLVVNLAIVVLRLHFFEKRFKDINQFSKVQSKLRRAKTMADAIPRHRRQMRLRSVEGLSQNNMDADGINDNTEKEEDNDSTTSALDPLASSTRDIQFGHLPNLNRKNGGTSRSRHNPQDMYRSLNMMLQQSRQLDLDEEEGPALIIRSPRDIEADEARGIYGAPFKNHQQLGSNNQMQNLSNTARNVGSAIAKERVGQSRDDANVVTDPETVEGVGNRNLTQGSAANTDNQEMHLTFRDQNNSFPSRPGQLSRLSRARSQDTHSGFRRFSTHLSSGLRHTDTGISSSASSTRAGRSRRRRNRSSKKKMASRYFLWQPTVGRNSTFVNLTPEQKDELGGLEYRSLKFLLWFVSLYYICLFVLGWIFLIPWINARHTYGNIIRTYGVSESWFGASQSLSSVCNFGMSLSADSLIPFQRSAYLPVVTVFLVLFGGVGLPVALRFTLWIAFKLTPPFGRSHETLGFLLDHPRRCFMLLFPSKTTWWLAFTVFVMVLIDVVIFMIVEPKEAEIKALPTNYRLLCSVVQSICTRTVGFTIVTFGNSHPAMKVLYVIMMYISAYPVAMSIRQTNVYDDQALGIYYEVAESEDKHPSAISTQLAIHMRRQLSHDMWYLVLGLLIICLSEGGKIDGNKFTVYDCLFEAVSAYANVGMSTGFLSTPLALSGGFNVVGKLVVMALMIRGRHRGLPYAIDRSIILRGEDQDIRDSIQAQHARKVKTLYQRDEPQNLWLDRVGTTASRFGRSATTRLRPAMTQWSQKARRSSFNFDFPRFKST